MAVTTSCCTCLGTLGTNRTNPLNWHEAQGTKVSTGQATVVVIFTKESAISFLRL
jgi:hypothetical protein